MTNNLNKAIDYFGSKAELARKLKVSSMVVYQWSKRKVPLERAIEIERISDGAVLASEIRPDVYKN